MQKPPEEKTQLDLQELDGKCLAHIAFFSALPVPVRQEIAKHMQVHWLPAANTNFTGAGCMHNQTQGALHAFQQKALEDAGVAGGGGRGHALGARGGEGGGSKGEKHQRQDGGLGVFQGGALHDLEEKEKRKKHLSSPWIPRKRVAVSILRAQGLVAKDKGGTSGSIRLVARLVGSLD